jgi:tetratricopeptide (TPR) repeat protein
MQSLKSDDRLESARHYVAINNLYYHQSLDFLNQSMVLDPLQEETGIHFLKILIYHQLHNETAAGIEFSRLCNSISDIKDEGRKLQTYQDVNKLLMRYDCSEYALELYGAYFEYLNEVSSPDVAIHVLSAGDLLLKEKSYLQAYQLHRQYLSLIEDEKKQQEETLVVADKYFAARAYQEALLFYESYLMNAGELGDYALFRQAESYYEVSQLDKAITLYEALIETYPDGEYYVLSLEALEDSYLNKNDFYNLSVIYSKMADAYPEDSYKKEDAYYHMAHAFFMDKNYRAAKEAFVDFINQYPDSNYTEACQKYLERIEKALEDSNVED